VSTADPNSADPISALHQRIEPLLRPYFVAGRWHIEPMPWPLTLAEFRALLGMTPWIGISWTEFALASSTRAMDGTHKLRLTICVKNPGRAARFFGDRLGPGLYPSLVTAAGALHGHTLGDFGTLQVSRAAQLYADGYGDANIAIGIVDLECHSRLGDVLGAAAAAPSFAQLVSSFSLSTNAGAAAGDLPIATDTIDLTEGQP